METLTLNGAEMLLSAFDENTIFGSMTGSRLYNLHHAESDYDYAIVEFVDKKKSTHSISEHFDVRRYDFRTLYNHLKTRPSHNATDLIFSGRKILGERSELFSTFESLTPSTAIIRDVFYRTGAKNLDHELYKRVRLGMYLSNKFNEFLYFGSYDPSLSEEEIVRVNFHTDEVVKLKTYDEKREYFDELFHTSYRDARSQFGLRLTNN